MYRQIKTFVLATMLLLFARTAWAYDFEVDGIYYKYSGIWVSVTHNGPNSYSGNVMIPKFVSYGGNTYFVGILADSAFAGCSNLTSVSLHDSLQRIQDYVFVNCSKLTTIDIPNSVEYIGGDNFNGCQSLTTINIGKSARYNFNSGPMVYRDCPNLTAINVSAENPYLQSVDGVVFNKTGDTLFECPKGKSGEYTIPNSVSVIFMHAFVKCTKLISVNMTNSVENIGTVAFAECSALQSVSFGTKVANIGAMAFDYDTALRQIVFYGENPPGLTSSSFDYAMKNKVEVKVPCGRLSAYKTALDGIFTNVAENGTFILSVSSADISKGTAMVTIPVTCTNPRAVVIATANAGYQFMSWNDGDTNNLRTLIMSQDRSITAYFMPILLIQSYDTNQGNVQMLCRPTPDNPQVTVLAVPKQGYRFAYWEDRINGQTMTRKDGNNTDNPRTLVWEEGMTLIAHFTESATGIKEISNENSAVRLYPNPAKEQITVSGLEQPTDIQIVNTLGQVLKRINHATDAITINVADMPKGIYFVKVGNCVRKIALK